MRRPAPRLPWGFGSCSPCTGCGALSEWWPCRYVWHLADTALGGRPVRIELCVRRLYCENTDCPKVTFAEQVKERHQGVMDQYFPGIGERSATSLRGRVKRGALEEDRRKPWAPQLLRQSTWLQRRLRVIDGADPELLTPAPRPLLWTCSGRRPCNAFSRRVGVCVRCRGSSGKVASPIRSNEIFQTIGGWP